LFSSRLRLLIPLLLALPVFAQTKGSVTGTIMDSASGRPIVGAAIAVNGVSDARNVTNAEGRYSIALSPGSYTLGVSAPHYAPVELTGILVKAGEATEASTTLANTSVTQSVDVVDTVGAAEATAEAMLTERKLAPVVSDSISHQELAGGSSSNAAGALEKVTGVSLVGDGFVYVRGLGERYSATELNGAMVPTTEPEKRVVPLDLFPTGMIENISIAKTYSPDMPAEFSGGLVQMKTIEFPAKRIFNLSLKSGFNTLSTAHPFLTSPGGGHDFWGFGSGDRGLPSLIPANTRLFQGQFTATQLQNFGRAFSDNWQPTTGNGRPQLDWSSVAGGTFGRFGVIGAVSFSNKEQLQKELRQYIREGVGAPLVFTSYPDYREYTETAKLGGVFNVAVRLTSNNKLVFRNTWTHDADKSAREFSGYDGGVGSDISAERLRYVERSVFSTGVEGEHVVPRWRSSIFHWQFNWSRSSRDEPDLREVIRNLLPDGQYIFAASGSSGIRFFSAMSDRIYEPQADWALPFVNGSVSGLFKVGFRATLRDRDFGARRFIYTPQLRTTLDLFAPSNILFGPDNIRPTGFQITEFTRATDAYTANMNILAGFAMLDLSFGSRWRFEGGFRIEDADQNVITYDNRIPNALPVTAGLQNTDPIPAANLIYALTQRQNIRVSFSRTLSRPDFRELSPFDFNDTLGGFVTAGNPDLKRASIDNYDLRWEMFPGGNQLLAASFFAKRFHSPIEQTIVPSNDLRETFVNAKAARNIGLELEFRRSLAILSPRLREFSVSSNFTFVDSNVEIKPEDATVVTSKSRPLLGQSRYIANGILEWTKLSWRSDTRFYVNYVSRRISDVGTFNVPDIYQEGTTVLDLVYDYKPSETAKWGLRFEAENLTNNLYRWTQGDFDQRVYRTGRTFQFGLNYSIF
jgi:outer membrane receptor protein involved in Fe transport